MICGASSDSYELYIFVGDGDPVVEHLRCLEQDVVHLARQILADRSAKAVEVRTQGRVLIRLV